MASSNEVALSVNSKSKVIVRNIPKQALIQDLELS